MQHVDTVFLDFDGVLVESVEIKSKAFRAMFADQPADVLAHIMAYHGANDGISRIVKLRHCHEQILGQALTDEGLDTLVKRYTDQVEDEVVNAPWVPGAREFLETHHRSHRLFVVSGTPEAEVRRIAERRGMTPWFEVVRGSPPNKADIVRELRDAYDLDLERGLFVGDAMADWTGARDAGVAFIGRVAPGRPSPFPEGTKTIADLRELSL